jgi:hypothetical protein
VFIFGKGISKKFGLPGYRESNVSGQSKGFLQRRVIKLIHILDHFPSSVSSKTQSISEAGYPSAIR